MSASLPLPARLLRGFAVDFLTSHDAAAVEWIMDPAYRLSIGGHVFDGRDDSYLPATAAQLDLFPGLCVTVHDVVLSPDAVAMRFTEHGMSARRGTPSSWGGICLFRIEDRRLRFGWAEEDYFGRKLQLKSGVVDAIRPPHPAPWDAPVCDPDPVTESAFATWIMDPMRLVCEVEEISSGVPKLAELVDPHSFDLSTVFSAGSRGAFHGVVKGTYKDGFADIATSHAASQISVPVAGIFDTDGRSVTRVQLCGDRLGLHRHLLNRM